MNIDLPRNYTKSVAPKGGIEIIISDPGFLLKKITVEDLFAHALNIAEEQKKRKRQELEKSIGSDAYKQLTEEQVEYMLDAVGSVVFDAPVSTQDVLIALRET